MILGTSETYRGDSFINVAGDLISCALGYNTARYFALQGLPQVPILIYFFSEFTLANTIRDNMALMFIQIVIPSER